jgi:hypothetical protein
MVRITERDVRLVAKCAAAQWLTTGQIQRVFFRDSTLDAVRKRLRKLGEEGYLRSSQEHRMAEMLHTVGRKGQALLAEKGWDAPVGRKVPDHVEHCIGINDLRLAVESASWKVHYFFAHWELGQFEWRHPVIPDAIFRVEKNSRLTFMAEYDRGPEGAEVLLKKLHQYEWLLGTFHFDAILVVADSEKLAGKLGGLLKGFHRVPIGVCQVQNLRTTGVEGRIFAEPGGIGSMSLADLACAPHDED